MTHTVAGDQVTVAAVNFEPVLGNKTATLKKMTDFVVAAAGQGAQIVLFPETALTGWSGFPAEKALDLAEPIPGPATDTLCEIARQQNVFVCFGMIEEKDRKVFNTAVLVSPAGISGVYRKTHPFEKEEPWAEPASEYPLVETPWGPIGMGICVEDYLYPEIARIYALGGAKILLHLTAIPEFSDVEAKDYRDFMRTTLGARAVENNMFVVCANLVGQEGDMTFFGYSMIIGPKPGHMNCQVFAGPAGAGEETIVARLDLASLDVLPAPVKGIFERRQPKSYGALVR